MSNGRVVEQGTHRSLSAQLTSTYRGLLKLQQEAEQAAKSKGGLFSGFGGGRQETMAREGSLEMKGAKKEAELGAKAQVSFMRLLRLNRPEWPLFAGGVLMCFVAGAMMPSSTSSCTRE